MSKTREEHSGCFVWLLEKGPVVAAVFVIAVLVMVLTIAYQLDRRLQGIERRLASRPPQRYQPPDLAQYAAGDVAAEQIAIEKQVYVPIYSHVYHNGGRPFLLEATLSIRNTDIKRPLFVRSVSYYDTKGELIKTHVDRLIRLAPLETLEFVVESRNTTGGSGANFIVEWFATETINEPIVEAVMLGTAGTQGICFRTSGRDLVSSGGVQ